MNFAILIHFQMPKLHISKDMASSFMEIIDGKPRFFQKKRGEKIPDNKQHFTAVFREASREQYGINLIGRNGLFPGSASTTFYMQCPHGKHVNLTASNDDLKKIDSFDLAVSEPYMRQNEVDCKCCKF